ncbi:MAG: family 16 glycoside hydrolase, partial [Bacteroidaceae bacterium]|nr:family 16 glycoside hydrolase [Bacteroidaceae bacterium]
ELLQTSKFSEKAWPTAFKLLKNVGGPNHEGFIGLQDHGDDVWYRNIKVKILD